MGITVSPLQGEDDDEEEEIAGLGSTDAYNFRRSISSINNLGARSNKYELYQVDEYSQEESIS